MKTWRARESKQHPPARKTNVQKAVSPKINFLVYPLYTSVYHILNSSFFQGVNQRCVSDSDANSALKCNQSAERQRAKAEFISAA